MHTVYYILSAIVGLVAMFFVYPLIGKKRRRQEKERAEAIIAEALKEKEEIIRESRIKGQEFVKDTSREYESAIANLEARRSLLNSREGNIQKKENVINGLDALIVSYKKEIADAEKDIIEKRKESVAKLLEKSEQNYEELKESIALGLVAEFNDGRENRIKGKIDDVKDSCEADAENIVKSIVQRYSKKNASRVSFTPIVATAAFAKKIEDRTALITAKTEAEIEFDEENGTYFVNHFNLVRRTVAYETLKKVVDARDRAVDVENILREETEKIQRNMIRLGEAILKELNIRNIPKEIVKLIGRLNYRTSFGQNIMLHSLEVAHFAGMLANEVGSDYHITVVSALLHDLGKAVDQEIEGAHDELTKQILEKYKMDPRIVHAAYNHHDAVEMESVEARLVQAADAMSASRPGARMEASEQYIERIRALEDAALSTEGVDKAYAIQAGREIRTYVDPDRIKDEDMEELAKKLAKEIEEKVQYPGQVMVNMIREFKVTEQAK